jgi:hypothetical protein
MLPCGSELTPSHTRRPIYAPHPKLQFEARRLLIVPRIVSYMEQLAGTSNYILIIGKVSTWVGTASALNDLARLQTL